MEEAKGGPNSGQTVPRGVVFVSRVVDASLVGILAACPFLAAGGGRDSFAVLAIIAVGGVAAIYRRGSRARRLSRCTWLLFFAIAVSVYLALQAVSLAAEPGALAPWAALAVKWGLVVGLAAWGFLLVLQGRGPRLGDAFDWGAALSIGILFAAGASFAALGNDAAVGALATPCALLGMHFVAREQCRSLHRARRLAQIATASAVVALVSWGIGA